MPDGGGGGDTTSLAEARVKIVLHGVGNWSLWKRFYYPNKWLSSLSIFFSLQLHAPYIPMPPQLFHSGPTSTAISRVNFLLLPCLPFTLRHYFPILSLLNSLTFLITTVNLPPPSSSISLVYLVLSFHLDFSLSLSLPVSVAAVHQIIAPSRFRRPAANSTGTRAVLTSLESAERRDTPP